MCASGTDVARGAADIVLLDDDFSTIVSAIEEGRALFHDIRKFLTYILTSNVPEIVPYLAMVALRIPPALSILQILAVDLGTDMVPALALGGERPEPGLMDRPPRARSAPLIDRELLTRAYLRLGVVQAVASMLGFWWVLAAHGLALPDLQRLAPAIIGGAADPASTAAYREASTVALGVIVVSQMGNLFACRSERLSAFRLSPFSNPLLWLGLAVELVLLVGIVYVPALQRVFGTAPLGAAVWLAMIAAPVVLIAADEGWKLLASALRALRARRSAAGASCPDKRRRR
jgi:Ca2+-transporting ATPase